DTARKTRPAGCGSGPDERSGRGFHRTRGILPARARRLQGARGMGRGRSATHQRHGQGRAHAATRTDCPRGHRMSTMSTPGPDASAQPHRAGSPHPPRQHGMSEPDASTPQRPPALSPTHGTAEMSEAGRGATARRRDARPSHRPAVPGQRKPDPESAGSGGRPEHAPISGRHTAADAYPAAMPSFRLSGRVAIVTGASSGLGAAVSRALAGLGARVAVVARRRDRLEALAGEIGGFARSGDLSDPAASAQIIPDIAERLGPPEILINAAGNRFGTARAESEPLDDIRRTLDLNLVAPLL